MTILQDIKKDQIAARMPKTKDAKKASLLTTLLGECETISKSKGIELLDSDVQEIVSKFIKNNLDAINAVGQDSEKGIDLLKENEMLSAYLPSQLSEEDLTKEIQALIDSGLDHIGKIMGSLKQNFPNQYDAGTASQITRKILG